MSERLMVGVENHTGKKIGGLEIGEMFARSPEPRYRTCCVRCGTKSTVTQSVIRGGGARCLNSGCGRQDPNTRAKRDRSLLDEQRRQLAALERQTEEQRTAASLARMVAETEGHRVLASRPSEGSYGPMSERERLALRERKEVLEAEERAERERREAPIRQATERLQVAHRKLAGVEKDRLLAQVDDPDRWIDPEAPVQMTETDAKVFNAESFRAFRQARPEISWTPDLIGQVSSYLERNHLHIVSLPMLSRLLDRFSAAGLVDESAMPQEVERKQTLKATPVTSKPVTPSLVDGFDLVTREPRKYTERELDRLSADDYRRALKLDRAALELPKIGPGPGGPQQ